MLTFTLSLLASLTVALGVYGLVLRRRTRRLMHLRRRLNIVPAQRAERLRNVERWWAAQDAEYAADLARARTVRAARESNVRRRLHGGPIDMDDYPPKDGAK